MDSGPDAASGVSLEAVVSTARLPGLMELLAGQWWTLDRTAHGVAQMLSESDIVVVAVDRSADKVVGFARILTDYTYVALVLDLIVSEGARGNGTGEMLMDSIVGHPRLADVRSIELVCQPDVVGFYSRWGFTERVGASRLMRRTSDERLTRRDGGEGDR